MKNLRAERLIRDIPDFPKPGIVFKDLTPVFADPSAFGEVVEQLTAMGRELRAEAVAGIEARGFILGAPVADHLGVPFVPFRKPGKLPFRVLVEEYSLEYGTNAIEVHVDAVAPGTRVLVVDDLLATGGTAAASVRLVKRLGGVVCGVVFLVELAFLGGRGALAGQEVRSLVRVDA